MKKLTLLYFFALSLYASGQSLKIEQVKDSLFSVTTPKKGKLSWTTKPDTWADARYFSIKNDNISLRLSSPHPIIKFEAPKENAFYIAPREIRLSGGNNFRDLGGYYTNDGHQVKWGKIYRSADISKLTDSDLKIISALKISIVCDLRGENEAKAAPDKLPAETERILLSAGSENISGNPADIMKYLKNEKSADSLLFSMYSRTDHLKNKYQPMFEKLLALPPDKALMFHCNAGKDRTGIGAALILFALGVDDMTILQDYEATNQFRKKYNEQYISALSAQGIPENTAKKLLEARPEYLQAAYEAIISKYGTVNNFMEKELGLTKEKLNLLKSKFLY